MKKIIGYIIGFLTILTVFGMICFVSVMYDVNDKIAVEPYFFRTGMLAINQTSIPQTISEIGESKLRDWLIQKFVKEYLYVVPDVENVARRTSGDRAILPYMMTAKAFKQWQQDIVPQINDLASNGGMRTVHVFNEIFKPSGSNYWRVDYELKTWNNPNDMDEVPEKTRGTMYVRISNEDAIGQLKQPFADVRDLLIKGVDPAFAFRFTVSDVMFDKE